MTTVSSTSDTSCSDAVLDALDREGFGEVRESLRDMHPAEIANLLEALPISARDVVWEQMEPGQHADVLAEANDEIRTARMLRMHPEAVARTAQDLAHDDAVDMLQDLPEEVMDEVLRSLDEQNRRRLESALAYPEDTAGGLMNIDALTVRADVTLEVVMRYLRAKGEIPEKTDRSIVVDRENRHLGMLRLAGLLINSPAARVVQVMEREVPGVAVETASHDVATLFEQRDLISAAVIDTGGKLLGRITIDDVVDVIRDEGEQSVMSMAGMDQRHDMFAPIFVTSRRRTLWLGVNLATALLASWSSGCSRRPSSR